MLVLLNSLTVLAQTTFKDTGKSIGIDNIVGQTFSIQSKVLNDTRKIKIYLPESYQETTKVYPVIYLLDGQHYFLTAVGFQQKFIHNQQSPEFIVVAIESKRTKRRTLLGDKSAQFLYFIENDVLKFVEGNYRTSTDKLLFGWEMAGGFTLHILATRPDLFSGYLVASMSDGRTIRPPLSEGLPKDFKNKKELFVGLSKNEPWLDEYLTSIKNSVKINPPKNFSSHFQLFEHEDHWSTGYRTIHHGIQQYFSDFKPLNFKSVDQIAEFGGLKAIKAHYLKRAQRYDIASQVDDETVWSLLTSTLKADEFAQFNLFVEAFPLYFSQANFHPIWGERFGRFYIKNNNKMAIEIFKTLINRFPDKPQFYKALGDAYLDQKNEVKAQYFHQRANDILQQQLG